MKSADATAPVLVAFDAAVPRSVRRHARTSMDAEICGVLLGREADGRTIVEASIAGKQAAQGAAHVTFTQDTWKHIYQVKDRDHPDKKIVGWYHSHPGFGVFLSKHDTFIHTNFFSAPHQVAWVFDPRSDEEGCFGWSDGRIRQVRRFEVVTQTEESEPRPESVAIPRPEPAVAGDGGPVAVGPCRLWRRRSYPRKGAIRCVLNVALLARLAISRARRLLGDRSSLLARWRKEVVERFKWSSLSKPPSKQSPGQSGGDHDPLPHETGRESDEATGGRQQPPQVTDKSEAEQADTTTMPGPTNSADKANKDTEETTARRTP